jgi:type I restriction enzyme, S subunit
MNAERLLTHYEKIADAPDAIARLRRFVLDLAVRGKLVPQDPKDEPASELLKRIAAEKVGERKEESEPSVVSSGNDNFAIPAGWVWTRLGVAATIVMGQSPPGNTYNKSGEGVPLLNGPVEFSAGPFGITIVNQYTTAPTNFCEKGDLLICVRGSTTGRTNIAGFRACIGRGVAAIRPHFDAAFIRLFIWNSRDSIIGMGRGIAFPSVSRKQIEDLVLPLPPVPEQRRIVAKVDELIALCDQLEMARAEREATRDRLTVASLARLNAPSSENSQTNARFVLDKLPALTARPDQINQWRQAILNLAVCGKLGAQSEGALKTVSSYRSLQNGYAFKSEWFSKTGIRLLRETAPGLSDDYLFMWINSPHFNEQIDPGRSNGVPHVSSKQVEAAQIYVPPVAEQERIVAKVNELLTLCDRLGAGLSASIDIRSRLFQATLTEALELNRDHAPVALQTAAA